VQQNQSGARRRVPAQGRVAGEAHFRHSKRPRARAERHARGLRRGEEEGRADHAVAALRPENEGNGRCKTHSPFLFYPRLLCCLPQVRRLSLSTSLDSDVSLTAMRDESTADGPWVLCILPCCFP